MTKKPKQINQKQLDNIITMILLDSSTFLHLKKLSQY